MKKKARVVVPLYKMHSDILTYQKGRKCPDCGGTLSIYNGNNVCSMCRQRRFKEKE